MSVTIKGADILTNKFNDIFTSNHLINQYCNDMKKRFSFDIEGCGSPYYEVEDMDEEELEYRLDYVETCFEIVKKVWSKCNFSNDLTVIYEDKYNSSNKGEKAFIERCCGVPAFNIYLFTWNDEDEKYIGKRYMWTTNKLDIACLFKKIILSDIGEDTELDCAVYIIDNDSENVFFLNDDRGIDVYSNDEAYIFQLKEYFLRL